jgi:hypothetical protein
MNRKTICLICLLISIFSCKKDQSQPDSGTSQLWLKVDQAVPDFKISLKCTSLQNKETIYTISYQDQDLSPKLKSVSVDGQNQSETWVLVYKDFDQTDEIEVRLDNGKVYKTRGFERKEKRLIELVSTVPGSVNFVDRDISILEKTIWVE